MAIDFSCILIWFLESWDHVKPSSKITLARSRKDDWNQSQNLGTIRYPDRRFRSRGAGKLMLVVLDVLEINQISVSRLRMNDVITAEPSNYTPPLSLFELLSTGGIVARYLKLHNPVTCTARRRREKNEIEYFFCIFPLKSAFHAHLILKSIKRAIYAWVQISSKSKFPGFLIKGEGIVARFRGDIISFSFNLHCIALNIDSKISDLFRGSLVIKGFLSY